VTGARRDAHLVDEGQLGRAGGRHDAVDHGIGKGALGVDPVGQRRVAHPGQSHDRLPQDGAVAAEVVAGQAGEGPVPGLAPEAQRRDHGAEGGAGRIGVRRVMDDVGVRGVEPAGRGSR
jgi:hypothetical protein